MPYCFSLGSRSYGGFIEGQECEIVGDHGHYLIVRLERNFGGEYNVDDNYDVYPQQIYDQLPERYLECLEAERQAYVKYDNVFCIKTGEKLKSKTPGPYWTYYDWPTQYRGGDQVWVHSRQYWGRTCDPAFPATVYQCQVGKSVLCSVSWYHQCIEVYDAQIEPRRNRTYSFLRGVKNFFS